MTHKKRPTVYVPHFETKLDKRTGKERGKYNVTHANRYGVLEVIFDNGAHKLNHEQVCTVLEKKMKVFAPNDYILYVGDPRLIAASMSRAASLTSAPTIRVLVWDKNDDYSQWGGYVEYIVPINDIVPTQEITGHTDLMTVVLGE